MSEELEKQRALAAQRQALEQKRAALPSLNRKDLQHLRQLEQQLRDARTREQAMAAGVKLLRADQPVLLDGQPLQVGEEQRLIQVVQLQVGDGVVLEIAPGGGQALEDLEQMVQSTSASLNAQLAALGVASVEAAAEIVEQRLALELEERALGGTAPVDLRQKEAEGRRCSSAWPSWTRICRRWPGSVRRWSRSSPCRNLSGARDPVQDDQLHHPDHPKAGERGGG